MKTEKQNTMDPKIKLKILEELAVENLDIILEDLGIFDYIKSENKYQSPCHIHNGDNSTAWCFYLGKNVWNCYTGDCHREYGNSIFDFVRAIKECTFYDAVDYLSLFLGVDFSKDIKEKEEEFYLKKFREKAKPKVVKKTTFKKDCLKKLDDCSLYMNKRGFDKNIIDEFECGYAKTGKLSRRVVFPVYDDIEEIIGFIGRTIYDKCSKCDCFHSKSKDGKCPKYATRAKWMCSDSLSKNLVLYNLNKAKKSIEEKKSVIITEGIIDLMRLRSAGIENVVSPLGINISNQQLILLLSLGTVKKIYLCSDDDKAGTRFKDNHSAYKDVGENKSFVSLSRYFNVEKVQYDGQKDIGEMSKEEAIVFCEKNELFKGE